MWDDGTHNQAELLAAELGFAGAVWAPNLTFPDGVRAGNAVIARWPIARHIVRALPREGEGADLARYIDHLEERAQVRRVEATCLRLVTER